MPDAREVVIVHMPLQCVSPRKRTHAPPNHQLTSEHIRAGLNALLIGHPLLDPLGIKMRPIHANSTACPLLGLHPAAVSQDMAPEFWLPTVFLAVLAAGDGALETGTILGEYNGVFQLEVPRRHPKPVWPGVCWFWGWADPLLGF